MDPNGGRKVNVDLGPDKDIYLARVDWAPDGTTLRGTPTRAYAG
mgnify:CR=1 FL=1